MSSRVHGSSGQKAIRMFNIVGVRQKKAGSDEEKAGGGERAVPGRAIFTFPPRRGGAPTPVLSPARRSAAGADRTWRHREAAGGRVELGSGSFLGGCYNQDIFKDPQKRHYHDASVLYNKDERFSFFCSRLFVVSSRWSYILQK